MRSRAASFAVFAVLASGCAADGDDGPTEMMPGERVYREPVADGNTFTCATCHSIDDDDDAYRRPGHALGDAAARPNYKNGQLADMRDAVNSCLTEWMNAEPWSADDVRWIDLEQYLRALAPGDAPAVDIRIVAPADDLAGGDATRGREVFDATCAGCHDEGGTGTNLAPAVAGLGLDPGYVATRVRTSGRSNSAVYPGLTGGVMPFWAADRLSDDELRDIVAWLARSEGPSDDGNASDDDGNAGDDDGTPGDGGPSDDGSATAEGTDDGSATAEGTDDGNDSSTTGDLPSNCPATHPHVGWIADLDSIFHGVGGRAEIVDDCTIVIHDFTYDGTGIDVRIYGGLGGDYDDGFAMTEDLLLPGGYDGVLLEAVLPEGRTLDDLDGISVWCVDVGVDFGSGTFYAP
jgi:cytochrome c553